MNELLNEWRKFINEAVNKAPGGAPAPGKVSYSYSENLVNFLKKVEGFSPKVYKKKGDKPTIGYGTTYYILNGTKVPVKKGDKNIDEKVADKYLRDFLNVVVMPSLNAYLKNKPMAQNQIDALASVMYNMGNSGFLNTELFTLASQNPNDPKIKDLFLSNKIATVGGVVSPGLKKRRIEEYALYTGKNSSEPSSQKTMIPDEDIVQKPTNIGNALNFFRKF